MWFVDIKDWLVKKIKLHVFICRKLHVFICWKLHIFIFKILPTYMYGIEDIHVVSNYSIHIYLSKCNSDSNISISIPWWQYTQRWPYSWLNKRNTTCCCSLKFVLYTCQCIQWWSKVLARLRWLWYTKCWATNKTSHSLKMLSIWWSRHCWDCTAVIAKSV